MNLLLLGNGSIGKRRASILESMGHSVKRLDIADKFSTSVVKQYDAVFICTPNVHHFEHVITCIQAERPFFCEKPLCLDTRQSSYLCNELLKRPLVNMVACNIRFTEEYKYLKNALSNVGTPLYSTCEFGYYLPYWREGDYKNYYSAYKMSGGGVMLDAIHEFDYLFDLFGNLKAPGSAILYRIQNTGELNIDSEDNATVVVITPTGHVIVIHLDYLQRSYKRAFSCVGTKGRIETVFNVQDSNSMYRTEMKEFLRCVKTGEDTPNTVFNHHKVLEFVENIKDKSNGPKNTGSDSSENE